MRKALSISLVILAMAAAARAQEPVPWSFSGNLRFEAEDLVAVAPREFERFRRTRDEALAEDAAFELANFYLRQGFPSSRVELRMTDSGAAFLIHEGPRVFLGEVSVSGTEHGETLAAFVKPPRTWILGPRLYLQASLDAAAGKMTAWLRQNGYLEAVLEGPSPLRGGELSAAGDETRDVSYHVTPGPVHYLGTLRFPDAGEWEGMARSNTRRLLGNPYGPFIPFDITGTLEDAFAEQGHPLARVRLEESRRPDGDEVCIDVEVRMDPGPRVRVGPVTVLGNLRVSEAAIRRELTLVPGDLFSSKQALASQQRLHGTQLFSQVSARLAMDAVEPAPGEPELTLPLTVRVEEVPFRHLDTSVGFGSWDLIRGSIGMEWLNLEGTGRSARIGVSGSVRGARLSARARDPWAFGVDHLMGTVEAVVENQERPLYTYDRTLLGVSFSREIGHRLVGTLAWGLSSTDVTEVSGEVPPEFENSTTLSSISLGLVREARDNPWDPRRGSLVSATFELSSPALGSDLAFGRLLLRAVQVQALDESIPGLALVGIVETGAIATFGDTKSLPIQERFFLGGGQSVRSFTEDDLGPRILDTLEDGSTVESGSAAGGEFFSRVSLELRIPLLGDLESALFLDAGNIRRRLRDAGFGSYRFALGGGLRYRTPLGPIRVDAGWNPSPKSYEDSWAIFFAIGYPF